jgi:tetratricopeptide (TPR) repeat protein
MMKVKWSLKNGKPEDLPTCIADIEAAIPDLEKVIADFKAGNYDQALTDALALVPAVEKAATDCLSSKKNEFHALKSHGLKDLPTCIADIEAAIPDLEKVIADFKAGNYEQALTDGLALVPTIEKAATDCLSTAKPHLAHGIHKFKKFLSKINVGDLPTCIADIEASIPDLEKIIADFKAGNYEQALTDGLALVPEIEKAYTDCLSSAKTIGGRFKTILKDDPKREYFEKLGAEFASGFFAGAKVDHFDSIDLYNCLHREPNAVELFYKADETMKYGLQKHEPEEVVKALDELIKFLYTMVADDYPGTKRQVCREF